MASGSGGGGGGALDPDSVWSRIQAQSVTLPPEVIDKLAELDLELSEGIGKKIS